jgi:hypothetical protein
METIAGRANDDQLYAALDLASRLGPASRQSRACCTRDAGETEQLGDDDVSDTVRAVDGHLAEHDEVVAAVLELGRERGPPIADASNGTLSHLSWTALSAPMRQRLAQGLLHVVGAERDDVHLAGAELFLDLQRGLDGVAVEVGHVPLEPRLVDGFPVGAILKLTSISGTRLIQTAIFTVSSPGWKEARGNLASGRASGSRDGRRPLPPCPARPRRPYFTPCQAPPPTRPP